MFGGGGAGGGVSGGEKPNALLNCMSTAADGAGETVARFCGLFGRSCWMVVRRGSPKTIRPAMISK